MKVTFGCLLLATIVLLQLSAANASKEEEKLTIGTFKYSIVLNHKQVIYIIR